MIEINDVLKKHDLRTYSYRKNGKVVIIDSNKGKLVLKEKTNQSIYDYLDSRSFNYYPKMMIEDNRYDIMEYLVEIEMPSDQKMLDLIRLVSLLHNKTTYYKNVDVDEYKKNYEEITQDIHYLQGYYQDLITIIESKVYMSPPELLLASNISIILSALNYSKIELEKWYELVKEKRKRRYVVLHNNLSLDHFIRNKSAYFISWDHSTIDIPIYDLYKLYKKYALDYDFESLLKTYEQNYPLLEEEKKLFFILISLPDKITLEDSNYNNCLKINHLIDYLYRTEHLVSPQYSEKTKPGK